MYDCYFTILWRTLYWSVSPCLRFFTCVLIIFIAPCATSVSKFKKCPKFISLQVSIYIHHLFCLAIQVLLCRILHKSNYPCICRAFSITISKGLSSALPLCKVRLSALSLALKFALVISSSATFSPLVSFDWILSYIA